jgi:hypothetical protein
MSTQPSNHVDQPQAPIEQLVGVPFGLAQLMKSLGFYDTDMSHKVLERMLQHWHHTGMMPLDRFAAERLDPWTAEEAMWKARGSTERTEKGSDIAKKRVTNKITQLGNMAEKMTRSKRRWEV